MTTGRPIAAALALLAAALAASGCGSADTGGIELPPEAVPAINGKLDEVQKRFEAGKCTGSGSAESSLESLREAVNGDLLKDEDVQLVADLNELLDNLDELIAQQCDPAAPTPPTTTDTTDTVPETTDTVPETTTTETTTDTTKTTTTTTDTTTDTTTTQPPTGTPGGPGGGIAPGGRNRAGAGPAGRESRRHDAAHGRERGR
ncbi:MAG: hypothetical protein BroJett022_12180 [Actinomycetes bacterium]|nr:MAG: hypothetical protein BroJett022_12180 [Actinomycetes bacterium]